MSRSVSLCHVAVTPIVCSPVLLFQHGPPDGFLPGQHASFRHRPSSGKPWPRVLCPPSLAQVEKKKTVLVESGIHSMISHPRAFQPCWDRTLSPCCSDIYISHKKARRAICIVCSSTVRHTAAHHAVVHATPSIGVQLLESSSPRVTLLESSSPSLEAGAASCVWR